MKKIFSLKTKITKYIIIGLVIGIILSVGYYFLDYQDTIKTEAGIQEPIGVSKEKVLLADQNEYDLDIVLNSIISNQIVLQESINLLEGRISSLEDKIILMEEMEEQKNDNN